MLITRSQTRGQHYGGFDTDAHTEPVIETRRPAAPHRSTSPCGLLSIVEHRGRYRAEWRPHTKALWLRSTGIQTFTSPTEAFGVAEARWTEDYASEVA